MQHRRGRWWWLALALVASGALAIRLAGLDTEPFWLDEVCTYNFDAGTLSSVVHSYAADVHPPLYGLALHLWSSAFGRSEDALRGLSVALSILGLICVALLVLHIAGDRWAALAAAVMLAVNPLDIWHARDARMYTLTATLATAAVCVLLLWLERSRSGLPRRGLVAAYALLATLLLYSHYLGLLLLGAQVLGGLALFSLHRRWRDSAYLLSAAAAASLLFAPWAAFIFRFRSTLSKVVEKVGWIPLPRLPDVFAYLNHEFFLGFATPPGGAASWFPVASGGLLAVAAIAALSLGPTAPDSPRRRSHDGLALMLWLALGPALTAATVSRVWNPVYFPPRFSLFCLGPGVVALFVMLEPVRPPLRTALVASLTALMATGALWQAAAPTNQGLREMSNLAHLFGEPDYALMIPPPHSLLVHYYLPHAGFAPSKEELSSRLRSGKTVVVWVGFRDGRLPPPASADGQLVAWLATTGAHRRLGWADGFLVYELRAGGHRIAAVR